MPAPLPGARWVSHTPRPCWAPTPAMAKFSESTAEDSKGRAAFSQTHATPGVEGGGPHPEAAQPPSAGGNLLPPQVLTTKALGSFENEAIERSCLVSGISLNCVLLLGAIKLSIHQNILHVCHHKHRLAELDALQNVSSNLFYEERDHFFRFLVKPCSPL